MRAAVRAADPSGQVAFSAVMPAGPPREDADAWDAFAEVPRGGKLCSNHRSNVPERPKHSFKSLAHYLPKPCALPAKI